MELLLRILLGCSVFAVATAAQALNFTPESVQGSVLHLLAFSNSDRISTQLKPQENTAYTVVAGDDLYHISLRFGITLACLEADNPQIGDPDLIFPGEVINIPSPASQILYTVVAGDDLFNIASKFNLTLDAVESVNPQITDPDLIFPGQVITIPASCAAAGETTGGNQPTSCPVAYTVVPGDFLFEIAGKFGVSLDALENANPQIADPDLIFPGQVITIPTDCSASCPVTYTVVPGDFLFEIAGKFGISLDALEAANSQIADPDLIFPGETVTIPVPCATTSSGSTASSSPSTPAMSPSGPSSTHISTKTSTTTSSRITTPSGPNPPQTPPKTSETEIIIGGSTITVGTGTSTIVVNSETIIIGPSGIGVGTETFPLPTITGSTVLTSDGVTFTIAPEPIPSSNQQSTSPPSQAQTSSETEIVIGSSTFIIGTVGSTVTIGSETVIIGPSGIQIGTDTLPLPTGTAPTAISTDGITLTIAPEPIPSLTQASITSSETEVIIGSSTFEIGTQSSTEIIGSETVIIGPSGVQIGTDTIPIPIPTAPTAITTDGITLTIGPIPVPPIIVPPTPIPPIPLPQSSTTTEVIIDGSTFDIGTASSTEIINGITIIIGPSGIQVGNDPTPILIPIVTATTAETTDGITFTFEPVFPGGGNGGSPPTTTPPPDIDLGPQTSVETGKFSTKTISVDLSSYSQTTTTIGGHHTILPVWPCFFPPIPFCAIIVIPLPPFVGGPPVGGIIPPPSCQPEITFGSNLLPTPIFTGELCTPTFTVTQTTTITTVDGGFSLSILVLDTGFTDTDMPTSSPTPTPPMTITEAPTSTFPAPTVTSTCQPIGLAQVSGSAVVNVPDEDDGITIFAPWADGFTTLDSLEFDFIEGADPWSYITFWQIDQGPGTIPIANGDGGSEMTISWTNTGGGSGTRLQLFFEPGQDDKIFEAMYSGFIECTPAVSTSAPPPPPTSIPPPNCPDTPSAPPETQIQCTQNFQAQRTDCLQLTVPAGIDVGATNGDRGITIEDCLDGTTGINSSGHEFCVISQVATCGIVVVFDDPTDELSRNDIVEVLNNSNEFCFTVCEGGPFESSVFTAQPDTLIRVCLMDPNFADQC